MAECSVNKFFNRDAANLNSKQIDWLLERVAHDWMKFARNLHTPSSGGRRFFRQDQLTNIRDKRGADNQACLLEALQQWVTDSTSHDLHLLYMALADCGHARLAAKIVASIAAECRRAESFVGACKTCASHLPESCEPVEEAVPLSPRIHQEQLYAPADDELSADQAEAFRAAVEVRKLEQPTQDYVTTVDHQQSLIQTLSVKMEAMNQEMKQTIASLQASFAELPSRVRNTEQRQAQRASLLSDSATASVLGQRVEKTSSYLARMDRTVALHDLRLSDQSMRQDILDVRSQTGPMVWKISELERRKREAVVGETPLLYSPQFYRGYKMCLRVHLDGDGVGRGTHMSLFFAIMPGDFDRLLQWPFQQKVTLMLLNQAPHWKDPGAGHIIRTFESDLRPDVARNALGWPLFAPVSALGSGSRFVRDDTVLVKVVIE